MRSTLLVAGLLMAATLGPLALPAGARPTVPPVELRAVQAAPAEGGIALFSLKVPVPEARCQLKADSPLVAVADPVPFPCPSSEITRAAYLPANQGRYRQRWWLTLTVTDRIGRRSLHTVALATKSAAWPGRRPLARVGIVGDSITNMSNNAMVAAMAGRYSLRIDGRNGYLIGQQLNTLRNTAYGPYGQADAVAVELGTNNSVYANYADFWVHDPALPQLTPPNGDWRTQLEEEVGLISNLRCGLLVNVTTSTGDPAFNATAREIDAAIAQQVATHRNLHLVDWAGALAAHPDWYGHGNLMAEIHPVPVGQRGLADLIATALATSCKLRPGARR